MRPVRCEVRQPPRTSFNTYNNDGASWWPGGLWQNRQAEFPPHRMLGQIAASGPDVVAKSILESILQQPAGPRRWSIVVVGARGRAQLGGRSEPGGPAGR